MKRPQHLTAAIALFFTACLGLMGSADAQTMGSNDGPIEVNNWGYVLQGADDAPLEVQPLAEAPYDLLVTDHSRDGTAERMFSADEVKQIQNGGGRRKIVAAYLSIGEADEFRTYWQAEWTSTGKAEGELADDAPTFLGPVNPDWPESRKVRYWEPAWQSIIFNDDHTGLLDQLVAQGLDAAYLDIVDGFYFWGEEVDEADQREGDPADGKDAARRMLRLIIDLTAHARRTNPNFYVIPQNGEFVLNDAELDDAEGLALRAAFMNAIGGIGVEDVYLPGDADENNRYAPDAERIAVLKRDFLAHGKPVLAVDYVNDTTVVQRFEKAARSDGFVPFAAPSRGLEVVALPVK